MTDGIWRSNLGVLIALLIVLAGCASYSSRIQNVRNSFNDGDLANAVLQLDGIRAGQAGAIHLIQADRAMLALAEGETQRSQVLLRAVRDGWDHLEQPDVLEGALSLGLDDRRLAYSGEDYEKVLVRCFLALANLLEDGSDVVPYCLQAVQKQEELILASGSEAETNPKLAYRRIALAPYLHGVVQEATHRNYDDASRAFATVAAWNPEFMGARQDLLRASSGGHSRFGNGVLYVFALVDPGPRKEERTAPVTSQALSLASYLWEAVGDSNVPGLTAPVKIPSVVLGPRVVDGIEVLVDGQRAGVTETVADIGALAQQQSAAAQPLAVARAVVRRITKKSMVYAAKRQVNGTPIVGLAMDAGCLAWEMSEAADLRCWDLLPGRVQVLRIELPQGGHQLRLRPLLPNGIVGGPVDCEIRIENGHNSYALACFPGSKMVGRLVTSKR